MKNWEDKIINFFIFIAIILFICIASFLSDKSETEYDKYLNDRSEREYERLIKEEPYLLLEEEGNEDFSDLKKKFEEYIKNEEKADSLLLEFWKDK